MKSYDALKELETTTNKIKDLDVVRDGLKEYQGFLLRHLLDDIFNGMSGKGSLGISFEGPAYKIPHSVLFIENLSWADFDRYRMHSEGVYAGWISEVPGIIPLSIDDDVTYLIPKAFFSDVKIYLFDIKIYCVLWSMFQFQVSDVNCPGASWLSGVMAAGVDLEHFIPTFGKLVTRGHLKIMKSKHLKLVSNLSINSAI